MEQYINPASDGRFYELHELVKANCHDCEGCSKCCEKMGDSIVLDPYDCYQLKANTGAGFEELLSQQMIALGVKDGLVLPHMKMTEKTDQCPFLNEEKRCSIHTYRPGLCRLFPLGRNFTEGNMNYILLTEECTKKNRSKVKIDKWLAVQSPEKYHSFMISWHAFRMKMAELMLDAEENQRQQLNLYLLHAFYKSMDVEVDFYKQYEDTVQKIENAFL